MAGTKALYPQGETDGTGQSTANTTEYWACGAAGDNLNNDTTTESDHQILHKNAGIFSNFTFSLSSNGISGGSTTFNFRINGANGNMSISVPASATGNFALANTAITDTIASGDLTGMMSVPGGATGTFVIKTMAVTFTNTSSNETITRLVDGGFPDGNANTASTTFFEGLAGEYGASFGTTEANAKCRMRKGGTIRNAGVYLRTNARTTTTTYRIRQNAANSTVVISVPSSSTGWFEDTSHTVTVAVNDDINWSIATSTGTGAHRITSMACDYVTTDGWFPMITSTIDSANQAAALTRYQTMGGFMNGVSSEGNHDTSASAFYTFAELTVLVVTNSIAAASTITFRINAADSALVATTTSSTTGVYLDSTHTASTSAPTDKINHKIITGGASGSLNIRNIVIWGKEVVIPQTVFIEWEEA